MSRDSHEGTIRILIADDDEAVISCYRRAFSKKQESDSAKRASELAAQLYGAADEAETAPVFEIVVCRQGDDAVTLAAGAVEQGAAPFDVVILDVTMPPGIDGIEAASRIRQADPDVAIILVSGYIDHSRAELEERIPPASKLHHFTKPLSFMQLALDVAAIVREG
jgi:CheY-like chemotaxis protein